MCSVFCTKDAAVAIKSYSPDLMVAPLLSLANENEKENENGVREMSEMLQRVGGIIVGPGLGRDSLTFNHIY